MGREFDSFTGLHYYRARWYDAQVGRFISEDPIGFEGGDVNLFAYVHNNSVNKSDPLGLLDPIVNQNPNIYSQDLNKLSCESRDKNPWLGVEGGGAFHFATAGLGGNAGIEVNPFTGQVCVFVKGSTRAGLGLFAGIGIKGNVDFQARTQTSGGKDVQPEIAVDAAIFKGARGRARFTGGTFVPDPSKATGYGGSISNSGGGIGFGPGIGLGAVVGIDYVKKYVLCSNPPPDCECKN